MVDKVESIKASGERPWTSVIVRQLQVLHHVLVSFCQLYQSRGGQRLRSLGGHFIILIWNKDVTLSHMGMYQVWQVSRGNILIICAHKCSHSI